MEFLINKLLSKYTYTKTGGKADFIVFPKTFVQIKKIINFSKKNKIFYIILGNLSNVIIKDHGIRGIVIMMKKINFNYIFNNKIIVGAGVKLNKLSCFLFKNSISGLEFLNGIPGTIGGAVYMNAGAYNEEIKNIFKYAYVLLDNGKFKIFKLNEMFFCYRYSIIQKNNGIILKIVLNFKKKNKKYIQNKMYKLKKLRFLKQPLNFPSCGSVFKRPKNFYTAQLIKLTGLSGYKIGGVQISEKHSGFIININNATSSDYLNMIKFIQKKVKLKFNVFLKTEVKIFD